LDYLLILDELLLFYLIVRFESSISLAYFQKSVATFGRTEALQGGE